MAVNSRYNGNASGHYYVEKKNRSFTVRRYFFFTIRRRHTRSYGDWSSDVCSSDLDFARASGLVWLAGLAGAIFAGALLLRDESRKRRWHGWLLRVPLVGRLIRGVNAARFADTLGILTASGVPLLASLQSAAGVLTNLPMRAAVDEAVRRVREGGALAPALGAAKLFPPLVIHLIASGEATGRLDTMLARAAEAQSRELVNWTRGLTALLGPLLILAMGVVVLFVVVAILLPIFEMNQLVR